MAYPQFQAPEWMTSRVSALRQKFASPQVGRLKRKMSGMMGMGYDPQSVQARRATMRGYGEGLGGIMGAAGESALSQYGQEYGTQFAAARLTHETGMEEERGRLARAEAERVREWQAGETEYRLTGKRPRRRTARMGISMAKGGKVVSMVKKPYLVGEEGPELFVPNTSGTIVPNPKTQKRMKGKSLYIPRQYGGWVHGPEQEKLRQRVMSKKYRDILSGGRGPGKGEGKMSPMSKGIMNYLMSKKMTGLGLHELPGPMWQKLLHKRPQMLAGMLSFLGGGKVDFGSPGGGRSPRPPKPELVKAKKLKVIRR